jgi:hypothetical protein
MGTEEKELRPHQRSNLSQMNDDCQIQLKKASESNQFLNFGRKKRKKEKEKEPS